ncbi:hypothetical protein CHGG_08882 [Chaetomium globosum CBS 148.51]|uniref:Uncharacterized protein n=1 Tax=Chaetomium globosum (strain ATCC 6205 / CBS 148.51 / DSM 1962 / NBRC 6347 / NRRL 1970) TaxID=306901 RepID=Q2GT22_CHAGB|nr:uncharacterized protein CHGG_08882 [Chaetomium globosum CBS 148.51]EAQ84868.1 hypothetical protein CHGG_08882 [Chaetomium globosum CBS 148.51]
MVQDIQGTGLGSLEDVYLAIISPLSIERKLPQPDAIIELARKHANTHKQSRQLRQSEMTSVYLWFIRVVKGLQEDIMIQALALMMDHLRASIDTLELLECQHVHGSGIHDSGIQLLKRDREKITKVLQDVDAGVLAFMLRLYQLQGRPWNCPLLKLPSPVDASYLIRKLRDLGLDVHVWALDRSDRSPTSVLLRGMENVRGLEKRDMLDWTPLYYTIQHQQDGKLASCLGQRPDVNARDLSGRTPLHYACQGLTTSKIQLLLQAGADINARDDAGMAPLHHAARSGSGEGVRLLIEAGADVNAVDGFGNAPLHDAAYAGSKATLMGCLEYANVKLRNHSGRTALHLAVIGEKGSVEERQEVVKVLMERAGVDKEAKEFMNLTPLHLAALSRHKAIVKLLVEQGVDKEAKDIYGDRPLHLATRFGHQAIVKFLIEQGTDKEAGDKYGRRPLHLAAEHGQENVVKLLIEQGTDKEAKRYRGGMRPLHFAAEHGQENIVKLLIEQGADKEAKCEVSNERPLHLAARKGHEAAVKFLVEQGADKEARDYSGRTPYEAAIEADKKDICATLRPYSLTYS